MSSGEEDLQEELQAIGQELKKRKVHRACDICRRKKIRCDGGQMPNNRCSNCAEYNLDCTYVENAKKRGPPKAYVQSLEIKLESMERLLQRLCPDADFTEELGGRINREGWTTDRHSASISLDSPMIQRLCNNNNSYLANVVSGRDTGTLTADSEDLAPSDDEYGVNSTLAESFKCIALESGFDNHFHGKSSGFVLVQAAINLKKEYAGSDENPIFSIPPLRRAKFWSPPPWEIAAEGRGRAVHYNYPPDDLIPSLVDNYFRESNPYLPLLHRPSFERALSDKLHLSNIGFGSIVMLVCALGARWSDDPRCMLDVSNKHSLGWKWFDQVQVLGRNLIGPLELYDLQRIALASVYLLGSASPQASWMLVGVGIRLAQDIGAHRRIVYDGPLSIKSELLKRAFWVLMSIDRFGSAGMGRPCAIQDEDFDLDLPLEVDDEYLEHPDPSLACKQPPGKPSYISFFNSFLKLNQVLGFALRTIYSINKSRILCGFVGPQWEQRIVAEIDSALNRWIDTVPDHLRWDPHRENTLFFKQSTFLYATYYYVQILVHRPFISSPRKPSPLNYPSLVICTNAARSCSHVLDALHRRGEISMPFSQIRAFSAGIVLLLNIWGAKKAGTFVNVKEQMADVHKCMNVLRDAEERMIGAGRLWDILNELASAGDIPMNKDSPLCNKREYESDSPKLRNDSSSASTSSNVSSPAFSNQYIGYSSRPIAGRRNIGSTSGVASIVQNPSLAPGGPSPATAMGGLSCGTAHLAHAGPEIAFSVGGTHASEAGMQHGHHGTYDARLTVGGMSTSHAWDSTLGGTTPAAHAPSLFPSLLPLSPSIVTASSPTAPNTVDLHSSSNPQLPYDSGNRFMISSNGAFPRAGAVAEIRSPEPGLGMLFDQYLPPTSLPGSDPCAVKDPASTALPQLSTGIASLDEALHMWSSAPTGFGPEDWESYLHNFSGRVSLGVGGMDVTDSTSEEIYTGSSPL